MKKALSLILAVMMLLGCMSVTAFADSTSEITATIADSDFSYEIVIPSTTTLSEANHTDVRLGGETGKATITVLKHPTANVIVQYTVNLDNGNLTDGTNTIEASYTYEQASMAEAADINGATVTVYENATVKDSTLYVTADASQWDDAPVGEYKASVEFNFNVLKKIDFKNVDGYDYYPVFDNDHMPEGVHYYKADGTEVNEMSADIAYATAPKDTAIPAVRAVKASWNDTFYIEGEDASTEYPCEATGVKEAFITNNLVGGNEDTESVCRFTQDDPTCCGVGIAGIFSAYKSNTFGGTTGYFWTVVVYSSLYTVRYYGTSNSFTTTSRPTMSYVLIERTF